MTRALLLFLCLCFAAHAQNPPVYQTGKVTPGHYATWTTNGVIQDGGGGPGPTPSAGPYINATAYGVVPDGVTSNDQALGNALYACSVQGATLWLPPGIIKLTGAALTGNATRYIQNCNMMGANVPGIGMGLANPGTMIELTSTSVGPFILGEYAAVQGITFYWPGQVGNTSFPPLFTDDGATPVAHCYFNNVQIVNAYKGIIQGAAGWVDVKFNNMDVFAANDMFRFNNTADGMSFNNVRILPGIWLGYCNSTPTCEGYVGLASNTETAFHITAGAGVNINAVNLVVVGARYGFYLDSGASMSESQIVATWDAVGTIIDTSAGGTWNGYGIQFTGVSAGCYTPPTTWGGAPTGTAPCFNMGSTGELVLTDFHSAGSQGDFIASGGNIILTASESLNIGSAFGSSDYYQVRMNGAGTPAVRIQNNRFGGQNGSAHTHGLSTTGAGVPTTLIIQGNEFEYLNDDVNASFPQGAIVSGNTSSNTNGSVSFTQVNTAGIVYYGNIWDKQPKPTLTSCGTSPSVNSLAGPNAGYFTVGGGTVTTCTINMPLVVYGNCLFGSADAISVGGGPSGAPPSWALSFYVGATPFDAHGVNVFYSCPGMN